MKRFAATTDFSIIFRALQEDGIVVIKGLLDPSEVASFNHEVQPAMDKLQPGSQCGNVQESEASAMTRRLLNPASESETMRRKILDKDLLHQTSDAVFNQADGAGYWLGNATVFELEPGTPAQQLHRDQDTFRFWSRMGPSSPEAMLIFFFALTPFTEANGATRVVPGSHRWAKFVHFQDPEFDGGAETIPVEMDPGDCFIMSSKLVHGAGHNSTTNERRRALAVGIVRRDLTAHQAYPLILPRDLVASMPYRVQSLFGFRSGRWAGVETNYTIWADREEDIGKRLGLVAS
ncbi:phytanoyl-CoA dioxygenase family protein [Aspergillus foveolatus]|uniref:phytanoyl-CoA dioxygenase family protein n=1 Tax=Aspergillus foveolatus TaxID=210207 RepID=UPI003CCD19D2